MAAAGTHSSVTGERRAKQRPASGGSPDPAPPSYAGPSHVACPTEAGDCAREIAPPSSGCTSFAQRGQLADQVRVNTAPEAPAWAAQPHPAMQAELIADIQVWRATTQVDSGDLRPTGPPQLDYAARVFQQQLDIQLADAVVSAATRISSGLTWRRRVRVWPTC
jgi:hypothetical protein